MRRMHAFRAYIMSHLDSFNLLEEGRCFAGQKKRVPSSDYMFTHTKLKKKTTTNTVLWLTKINSNVIYSERNRTTSLYFLKYEQQAEQIAIEQSTSYPDFFPFA